MLDAPYTSYHRYFFLQLFQLLAIGIISFILNFVVIYFKGNTGSTINTSNEPVISWIITILVASLFETLVFQFGIFHILKALLKNNDDFFLIYVMTSAILFDVVHLFVRNSNPIIFIVLGFIMTFLGGLVLAVTFHTLYINGQKPFLTVFLLHFIYDLFVALVYKLCLSLGINIV